MVRCSFPDNSTIIGKDVEIQVGKCNEFQCFEAKMDYEMPVAQMKKLFALSGSCMQKIDFKCKLAPLKVNEIILVFKLVLKCVYCNRGPLDSMSCPNSFNHFLSFVVAAAGPANNIGKIIFLEKDIYRE